MWRWQHALQRIARLLLAHVPACADGKGLDFSIELSDLHSESIISDAKRLQQVLKNLLSNALKFTEHGSVSLRIERAITGWSATIRCSTG